MTNSARLSVTVAMILVVSAGAVSAAKPNVVFILTDDLGYGDVKCFGGDRCRIETPYFDQLAREGMRFTNAHAIGSVCVPSRVGIMTGRYAWRFGSSRPGGPWGFLGTRLPDDQHTLGTMLQSVGYRTAYVGKWHLGTLMATIDGQRQNVDNVDYSQPLIVGPPQYGFDESFVLPGSLDMYPYAYARNNRWQGSVTAQKGWSAFNRVGPAAEDFEDTEVLDTFCDEAETFIGQHANRSDGRPFFLYLALTSPHTPLSPSAEFEGKSPLGVYGDFVMETDHCVGRILRAIEDHGLQDNTLVIATSDHGAAPYAGRNRKATNGQLKRLEADGHYASGIFRGYKFTVYEGGFRVPFVARWPSRIRPGTSCDRLVGLLDLMATLADVVDHPLAPDHGVDSISMLPLFEDPNAIPPRKSIVQQATRGMSIRTADWKLAFCPGSGCEDRWLIPVGAERAWTRAIGAYGRKPERIEELLHPAFVQLFHLREDPGETNDLAGEHPERIRELHALFQTQVTAGRSTPGPSLDNDRRHISPFSHVPDFVWTPPARR